MKCPNCDNHIGIEDYESQEQFNCEHCDALLEIEVDEGTYFGATHTTLKLVDEDDTE